MFITLGYSRTLWKVRQQQQQQKGSVITLCSILSVTQYTQYQPSAINSINVWIYTIFIGDEISGSRFRTHILKTVLSAATLLG